jgi:hypothetical protein
MTPRRAHGAYSMYPVTNRRMIAETSYHLNINCGVLQSKDDIYEVIVYKDDNNNKYLYSRTGRFDTPTFHKTQPCKRCSKEE